MIIVAVFAMTNFGSSFSRIYLLIRGKVVKTQSQKYAKLA
jgi:hypothetical protein